MTAEEALKMELRVLFGDNTSFCIWLSEEKEVFDSALRAVNKYSKQEAEKAFDAANDIVSPNDFTKKYPNKEVYLKQAFKEQ